MQKIFMALLLVCVFLPELASAKIVPVDLWAEQYISHKPIPDARITDLESGDGWETGADGYVHTQMEEGRLLTLLFQKTGFPDIQTESVNVAQNGMDDPMHEITLQIPEPILYNLLKFFFGTPPAGLHHMVVEVERCDSNLHRHHDHGEPGAHLELVPLGNQNIKKVKIIYLGKVPILGYTEWLGPVLSVHFPFLGWLVPKESSRDGGVMFLDIPEGDYKIIAHKKSAEGSELSFTESLVKIGSRSPAVINVSTPQGPRSLQCDFLGPTTGAP